jgi:hypothetical protein
VAGGRFPKCARAAVMIAIAPVLLAVLVQMLAPLLLTSAAGCQVRQSDIVVCPQTPFVDWVVAWGWQLARGCYVTVPVAIGIYLVCRHYSRGRDDPRI